MPSQKQQEQGMQGSGCAGLLVFIVTIAIYQNPAAGKGGDAVCSQDVTGYLFIAAWVALGQFLAPMGLGILNCFTGAACEKPIFVLNAISQVGAGVFGFVWFIIGNFRLYATKPCELPFDPKQSADCCSADLYGAVHGWFVFNYVMFGILLCCCCTCCLGLAMGGASGAMASIYRNEGKTEKTPLQSPA